MEMTGAHSVPAPVDRVWRELNDPDTLRSCIPGCESIDADGENAYRVVISAKVGPVAARFSGKMRMEDIDAPRACRLRFDGNGGVAGFVNGEARVNLTSEDAGGTTLAYTAKAQIGGKLAQLGSRLVDGAARKLTDEFFERFVAVSSQTTETPMVVNATPTPAPTPSRGKYVAPIAVIAAIVAALAVTYLRSRGS
jgi:carbon monoxide dehydrogenase subunit G